MGLEQRVAGVLDTGLSEKAWWERQSLQAYFLICKMKAIIVLQGFDEDQMR